MPLMLGLFSLRGGWNKDIAKPVLADFSLQNQRQVHTLVYDNALFSVMNGDDSEWLENDEKSILLIFVGFLTNLDTLVQKLTTAGCSIQNKESSAECILHLYKEKGDRLLQDIQGIFSLAIYDKTKGELLLANDPFGLYPLFCWNNDDWLIFGSEYEPITRFRYFNKTLNLAAIASFFVLGTTLGEQTFFRDLINLAPGSLFKVHNGSIMQERYDELNIGMDRSGNMALYAKLVAESIHWAVQSLLRHPESIQCSLTGGADTRMLVSNLNKEQRQTIKFYTNRNRHLSDEEDRDVIIARIIAERLGLQWLSQVSTSRTKRLYGTPYWGTSYFDQKRIKWGKKTLGCWFGGEFLGGCALGMKIPVMDEEVIRRTTNDLFEDGFRKQSTDPWQTLQEELAKEKAENNSLVIAIQTFTRSFFTRLYGGSRAAWLEPYMISTFRNTPFLDPRLLKTLLAIPAEYIRDYNLYNQVYKRHFPELTDIPSNAILARRKDSCIPKMTQGTEPKSVRRLKDKKMLQAYLRSHITWDKGFFKRDFLNSLAGNSAHPLLVEFIDFEAWYRKFTC